VPASKALSKQERPKRLLGCSKNTCGFFAAGSLFKFKKFGSSQKMFGPSYFFRPFFCGQFEQKDRNCLLASSSKSQLFISGKNEH
jgi:hypothetical protein